MIPQFAWEHEGGPFRVDRCRWEGLLLLVSQVAVRGDEPPRFAWSVSGVVAGIDRCRQGVVSQPGAAIEAAEGAAKALVQELTPADAAGLGG